MQVVVNTEAIEDGNWNHQEAVASRGGCGWRAGWAVHTQQQHTGTSKTGVDLTMF